MQCFSHSPTRKPTPFDPFPQKLSSTQQFIRLSLPHFPPHPFRPQSSVYQTPSARFANLLSDFEVSQLSSHLTLVATPAAFSQVLPLCGGAICSPAARQLQGGLGRGRWGICRRDRWCVRCVYTAWVIYSSVHVQRLFDQRIQIGAMVLYWTGHHFYGQFRLMNHREISHRVSQDPICIHLMNFLFIVLHISQLTFSKYVLIDTCTL